MLARSGIEALKILALLGVRVISFLESFAWRFNKHIESPFIL
jgi:hypothetical protein